MGENLDRLKSRLADIHNLSRAASVLGWDQQTYMPPGGASARAEHLAALSRITHDMFTSDDMGEMLERAAGEVADLPEASVDASLVRVARRDYEQDRKVPTELVVETSRHSAAAYAIWVEARAQNDYDRFAPCLQRTIDLSRERAEALGYEGEMYDALLDQYEPGMTAAQVRTIFAELRAQLIPLVQAIAERADRVSDAPLHQPFDEVRQEAFGHMVAERYGYDFSRGRQDRTVHPFETTFSRNDVRITTRFEPEFLNPALFGTMHETGHALYEQGIGESLEGTLLARGTSLGVHESQSRMWENVVGRSKGFWSHFYPELQRAFPEQLSRVDLDTFYAAINRVEPSFIRVEADELTYNLHILLRFEIEVDMLEGRLSVADAPVVWNDKMREYLGVVPPTNTLGILQDVHWSGGMLGYFSTYSLGNILSLQLWDAAVRDVPGIPEQIAQGEFDGLRGWLTQNIYQYGRIYEPGELIQRATGEPLQTRSYVAYLKRKYGELYGISA